MNQLKNSITIAFTFLYLIGYCQWSESFSDGELNYNPAWKGDTTDYIIVDGVLKLNAQEAGSSILYTPIQPDENLNWIWEFRIDQNFAGSANNQSRIFLWSQSSEFYNDENPAMSTAYYLQFGESGSSDAVELFRIDEGSSDPVSICRGIEGNISSSFENKYRIIYSQGAWQIWSGNWSNPYYQLEASGIDSAQFSEGYFALFLHYTSSNTQNFSFDDILTGIYSQDISPPEISTFEIISGNQLLIEFSEAVDSSAIIASHYEINESSPEIVDFTDTEQQKVLLDWESIFPANQLLTLNIDSLSDITGNLALNLSIHFSWNPPFEADSSDILFNEIMSDPTPLIGLPEAEYIELYNPTDSMIILEGYTFYNSAIPVVLPYFLFEPNSYLILSDEDDTSLFQPYGLVLGLPIWPALVNSGDSLSLINPSGETVDLVTYDDSWYLDSEKAEGGWSLERINPIWPCEIDKNWRASENNLGGTPGYKNSVFNDALDSIGLKITELTILSDQSIQISLSEVPINSFITVEQVVIPGLDIIVIEYSESLIDGLVLSFLEPLNEDQEYLIWLENIYDCWGNPALDTISFNSGFFAKANQIVINELMADPSPQQLLPEAEFIELFNTTDHILNLIHWQIDNSGTRKEIPDFILEPNGYAILCREEDTSLFSGYGKTIGMSSWKSLTNNQDSLALINEKGVIISQANYNNSWYKNNVKKDGGWSLEKINPYQNCNGLTNWAASESNSGGTPGVVNSVQGLEIENEINLWQAYLPDSNTLVTSFSGEPDTLVILNSSYQTILNLGITLRKITIGENRFDLYFNFNSAPIENIVYQFKINGLKTCDQKEVDEQIIDFGLAVQAANNEIIINEILFDPVSGASDFVEVMNTSEHFIDLKNWRIIKSDDFESIEEIQISEEHLIISPGKLLAFSPNPEELQMLYPESFNINNIKKLSGLPNFNNDRGIVIIRNEQLKTIDSLNYSAGMHFSLLADLNGVSLERISPSSNTNDPLNWTSAAEIVGFATPGSLNSQFFKLTTSGQVNLEPELFTPDNDGYHDQLHINYKLIPGGWMGNIKIYSDKGIEIRRLINNDWLGSEGSKAWDGTNNEGEKVPVGIYIVYFEVFNAQGQKQLFKQPCVLGSKL